jgi:hypothetical protein
MQTKITWHRAAVLALAAATLLSLTACAPSAPPSTAQTAAAPSSPAKEAGLLNRDIHVCFNNTSATAATIEWLWGVNTNSGSGTLKVGQTLCGEGVDPTVRVTFANSFATKMSTGNPMVGEPGVSFDSIPEPARPSVTGLTYTSAKYAPGESVTSDVEGHHFSVTRNADDDWINFTVTILD